MTAPTGRWRLIAPAEDSTSARELAGAVIWQALVDLAKALGLRWSWDEKAAKLYIGLPKAAVATVVAAAKFLVPVWYSQRDSKIVHNGELQAGRMCFSTSCAMILKTRKPGALSDSPNADDEYLQRVFKYGDTTEAHAQISALRHFGLEPDWRQTWTVAQLDAHLKAGGLAACGILHHGPASRPTGGGHYVLVYGIEGDNYLVHDPYGEIDNLNGGYLHADGRSRRYSRINFSRRWQVPGPASGWAIFVD